MLPKAQQALWPELSQLPRGLVLYGGTAIALRLAHRQSLDFDFFSSEPVAAEELLRSVSFLSGSKVLQSTDNTLTVVVERGGPVKLSFFGGLTIGRVGEPEATEDGVLQIASMLDLAGVKAAVVSQRAEAKDYLDLLAMFEHGISLGSALGAARALYAERYNPIVTLKALSYFDDGDLRSLSAAQKAKLTSLASAHLEIPQIARVSDVLSAL